MKREIERKFLVTNDTWRDEAVRTLTLRQGYLSTEPERIVRVRLSGDEAWLTVKGKKAGGGAPEFEYPVPAADAAFMLDAVAKKPLIEKTRHLVPYEGFIWEVDEFFGDNAGLIIAEIELASPDQTFSLPPWAGVEVTEDTGYHNSSLVTRPFKDW